jgi:thioesterase domain-containing protein/acyl carrier protein
VAAAIRTRRVTVYHSVPSLLRSLVAVDGGTFPDVRVVRLEGDRAAPADAVLHRRHFPAGSVLANGLGTTETGLCRQLRLRTGDPIPEGVLPVGWPVPGMEVAVVDDGGARLPAGEVGEIAVTGRRLALGYWGRPDLTAAAFAADPDDPALRTYRTGDLGRMDADGTLALLGRRDGGLKVDGVRVEPAEVEAHLLAIPGVIEAAVTTYAGRRGEGRLAAYLVVDGTGPGHIGIREHLLARLPAAMVPATLVFVASLPLTASGKLDRAALVPVAAAAGGRAPTADEAALIALWEEVLERPGIGLDDDFIAAGGDSLAAAELLAALEERAGHALPDGLLVRAPTVARMAAALRGEAAPAAAPGIVPLQPLGRGTPLVVVHGADFSTNTYAWLVRALGMGRPVWGLDAAPGGAASVAEVAGGHADAIAAAAPDGRVLLAGFCSGGVVAMEVARRLRAGGADVALLALIGVGGADFPGLLAPPALARWRSSQPAVPLRRRIGRIVHPEAMLVTLRGHRPARLPGTATLFLSGPGAGRYTADPSADWAALAERTEVVLLAGDDEGLMHEPGVGELARELAAAMDAADAGVV